MHHDGRNPSTRQSHFGVIQTNKRRGRSAKYIGISKRQNTFFRGRHRFDGHPRCGSLSLQFATGSPSPGNQARDQSQLKLFWLPGAVTAIIQRSRLLAKEKDDIKRNLDGLAGVFDAIVRAQTKAGAESVGATRNGKGNGSNDDAGDDS